MLVILGLWAWGKGFKENVDGGAVDEVGGIRGMVESKMGKMRSDDKVLISGSDIYVPWFRDDIWGSDLDGKRGLLLKPANEAGGEGLAHMLDDKDGGGEVAWEL